MAEKTTLRGVGILLAQVLGAVWTLPNTLAGLIAGTVALARGAQVHVAHGALVFDKVPFGPGGALTLGQVILHTGDSLDTTALTYWCKQHGGSDCVHVGEHERAHVYQYLALGPLFLPLYFLCGGISWRNRFEQAADQYAQARKGWWPWPRPPGKPQAASDRSSIS